MSSMIIIPNEQEIEELLTRSIQEILPSKEDFKKKLLSGEKIKIYIGTDATGTSLHLGHATNYIILEKLRRLGHEVIFLIGDFTSRIGDPTDKDSARVPLTRDQVIENTKTWMNQIRPIIDMDNTDNPVKVLYNHDWLSKMNFEDIIDLASNFTVQQMLERDMFEKRMNENKPIHVHEFFYPLMQGWDSVVMDVDVEMCGNDQKFNALVGRTLQKRYNNKEKFVFITTLLENPKTGEKMMSKSLGVGVFLDFTPENMYGGIMSQPDENMKQLYVDTTLLEIDTIEEILKENNPMQAKQRLAFEITKTYHGQELSDKAAQNWSETFQKGGIPEDVETFVVNTGKELGEVLIEYGVVSSKTDWRRLVDEGAVSTISKNDEKISDHKYIVTESMIIKIGKKRFAKIDIVK